MVCYIFGRIKFTLLNMWNWRNNYKFNLLQLTQYIEYMANFPAIILFELCSYVAIG